MSERIRIADLEAGAPVANVFLLQNMVLAKAKSGKSYMTLTLADKDGTYQGKLWDQADLIHEQLEKLTPVEIDGVISVYREKNQVTVRTIRTLAWSDELFERLVPTSKFSLTSLTDQLDIVLARITDPGLAGLVKVLRHDEELMQTFCQVPAAKWIHHAYLRGLLEHTTSMITIASFLADHYEKQFPGLLDLDVLLTGTLLHDMGKTVEYEYKHGIDITTRGRLIGHLVLGMEILNTAVAKVPNLSQERADRVRHLIASHHGDFEKGAPIRPVTIEAQLLHLIDYLDSQINAVSSVLLNVKPGDWSEYSRKFERSFFRPEPGQATFEDPLPDAPEVEPSPADMSGPEAEPVLSEMTTIFVPEEDAQARRTPPAELEADPVDPPPVETAEFENVPPAEDEPPHPAHTAINVEGSENADAKQDDNDGEERPRKRTLF
jgi:3'-5' exoribonuclease